MPANTAKRIRYANLWEYVRAHDHLKEWWIAQEAGIEHTRFSKLKNERGVTPYSNEVKAIAGLLNQSEEYVRELYGIEQ